MELRENNKNTLVYIETSCWPFNLWADILDSPRMAQIAETEGDSLPVALYWPNLDDVLSAALDDRCHSVIRMRYEQGMTYARIGNELGLSQERVRQIITRSLRELREPQYFRRLRAIPESEVLLLRSKIQELIRQQDDLKKQITSIFGEAGADKVEKRLQLPLDSYVDSLGVSIRTRNCLIANGKKTIADLIQCKESTISGFRHLGKLSIAEIKSALAQNGYSLMPEE